MARPPRVIDPDLVYHITPSRYVVLNPVRAGICATADSWPWSSYHATAGLRPSPWFLSAGWLLELFSPELARARYRDFVADGTRGAAARGRG